MSKSVSSIYDSIENLAPFYPDVAYSQPKDRKELELDKMREDAMFLKRTLDISYEQVLRWLRNVATNDERNECEVAIKQLLSNCEENVRNNLMAICRRYSLSVAGEATCSQETPSPSPKEKSDITAMKQVRTTKAEGEGQKVTHVTQEVQVEVPNAAVRVSLNKKEKEEYWEAYYSFWDDFVREWYNQRRDGYKVPQDEISKEYDNISKEYDNAVANLVFDELPNPYFGDPKNGVDAVIINLNPGGSEKDANKAGTDATQFYSNLKYGEHGKGWLMWKFVHEAGCSYRGFIGNDKNLLKDGKVVNWSQLNPELRGHEPEVCGVKWWQGTDPHKVGGRVEWLGRISNGESGSIHPLKVFALELCPYHSRSFDFGDNKVDDKLLCFIIEHVIRPALNAVVENDLIKFAVAIGKTCAVILEQLEGEGKFGVTAKLEKEWWDESEEVEGWNWPLTKDKNTGVMRRVHRKYCLFALKDKTTERMARFLVCIAPGSNGTSGKKFKKIEELIRCEANNPLTNESYGKLMPLTLRWWSYAEDSNHNTPKQDSSFEALPEDVVGPLAPKIGSAAEGQRKLTDEGKCAFLRALRLAFEQKLMPGIVNEKDLNESKKQFYPNGNRKLYFEIRNGKVILIFRCKNRADRIAIMKSLRDGFERAFSEMMVKSEKVKVEIDDKTDHDPQSTGPRYIRFKYSNDLDVGNRELLNMMVQNYYKVYELLNQNGKVC